MQRVELNDVGLVYDVAGSGDPVLLICGTGQPAFSWGFTLTPALTGAGYQVVTFDNRGMPPSDEPPGEYSVRQMADDAAALIEHLNIAPCRVAGLSLGAFITQELALARPDLVRCAVMMGTFGRQDGFRREMLRSWIELDESGISLPRRYDAIAAAFSLFTPATLNNEEAMDLYIEGSAGMPAWEGLGRSGQHHADVAYDNRLHALAGVRVPAMVIAFDSDMVTPPYLGKEVADAIPGCRYVEIAGAGHAGPVEKPDEVNSALLKFFAEV